jgi:hypothetical protein
MYLTKGILMARAPRARGSSRDLRNDRISVADKAKIVGGVGLAIAAGASLYSLLGKSVSTADPYSGASVLFPEDLIENDHWIEFVAQETKGFATDAIANGLPGLRGSIINGGTIRLPMPSNLSTDYNPLYTEQDLGAAAGGALKPFDRNMYGNRDLETEAQMGTAGSALATAAKGGLAGAAVTAGVQKAASIPGVGAEGVNAALKVLGGVAVNPHKVVLFTGVGFRDHTFSWKLSPRNRKESNDIQLICEMFKFYSHPEYLAGGLFFKYPEFFKIRFRHPSYLFELEPSVCTDVRIDYHGQGFPAYIRDADGSGIPAPAEITLSLTFKETEVITKNTLTRGLRNVPTRASNPPSTRNQTPAQMPATDALGNPLGNGLDVHGNPIN